MYVVATIMDYSTLDYSVQWSLDVKDMITSFLFLVNSLYIK